MDEMAQENVIESIEQTMVAKKYSDNAEDGPRDKLNFFVIVFLFLGISQFLPYTFYSAANNYWLYKFRDTSIANYSSDDRTGLQVYYGTANIIAGAGSVSLFNILNIVYGQRFPFLLRIKGALLVITCNFLILQIFSKINTDNFQIVFFAIAMACYATIMASQTVYTTASMMLFICFPPKYMYVYLLGQNAAGILNGIVQIVSVSVLDSIEDSAFVYFTVGTLVVILSLVIITLGTKMLFFRHHMLMVRQRSQKKMTNVSKHDFWAIIRAILPRLSLFFVIQMGYSAVTCVTGLAVSQDEQSVWGKKYFYPVISFLFADIMGLVGKFISSSSKMRLSLKFLTPVVIVTPLIFAFLIWSCNIKPKSTFPVWFPMDYQYALILGTFCLMYGFILNNIVIDNVEMVKRQFQSDMELAFNLYMLGSTLCGFIASPIGLLALKFI